MFKKHRGIIFLLLAALILRILLLWYATGLREHPDILRWKDWGRIAFLYGFADTYTPDHLTFGTYPNNMPPGTLYIVSSMYWLWLQFGKILAQLGIAPGSNPWVNIVFLRIFLNIPSLIADLGIGAIVYAMVNRRGKKGTKPLLAASLYLFNPAALYNSAVWGQMDSINNLFFMFSLWFLTEKRIVASAIMLVVSLLVKFSLLFIVPFWAITAWIICGKDKKPFATAMFYGTVLILLSVMPLSDNPIQWILSYLASHATGEMTNITAFAYNAWWVLFRPELVFEVAQDLTRVVDIRLMHAPLTQTMYGSVSLGFLAVVTALVVQFPVYVSYLRVLGRRRSERAVIVGYAAVLSVLSYLFLPQMHERYLYPAFAPFAVLVGFGVPVLRELIVLSMLSMINLVSVWHPMPLPLWIYPILRDRNFQWWTALATTGVAIWTIPKLIVGRKTDEMLY